MRVTVRPGYAYAVGLLAAVGAGIGWGQFLNGEDLRDFYATAAQVLVGLILAFVIEGRVMRRVALNGAGVVTMLWGLVAATTGLLVTDDGTMLAAACFSATAGGLAAGITAMFLLVFLEGLWGQRPARSAGIRGTPRQEGSSVARPLRSQSASEASRSHAGGSTSGPGRTCEPSSRSAS